MSGDKNRIYGVDLGTTYSSAAYVDDYGKTVVVPNLEGKLITPSVVFFDGDDIVVGEVAKESAKLYPDEVVSFIKRSMGEEDFFYETNGKTYRAEEISSFIIRKVVQDAEQHVGEEIKDIVITCPAYFGINEREATQKAGEIAGYNVRQIINEPTAAAIAYGITEKEESKVVLVYDLGGGTFDITMIEIRKNAVEVICTGGDHNLGGKDWDDRLIVHLAEEFQSQTGTTDDILDDPDTCQDLLIAAEKAKMVLTNREKVPVAISHKGEKVKVEVTRKKFEELTLSLLERTIEFTHDMLIEAQRKGYTSYDEIILVGGSTRMPMVTKRIQEAFALKPNMFDPDGAVACGAALFGWKLTMNRDLARLITDETAKPGEQSTDLIVKDAEEKDELESIIVSADKKVLNDAARKLAEEKGLDLHAVQRSLTKVTDVASKSFGIIVKNYGKEEEIFNLILRNSPVPAKVKRLFYTAANDQKEVLINIMETETGEQSIPMTEVFDIASASIGTAVLTLPPGLEKDSPVDINFSLNKEGRLIITAEETESHQKVEVVIDNRAVIQGKDLAKSKSRCQDMVVH